MTHAAGFVVAVIGVIHLVCNIRVSNPLVFTSAVFYGLSLISLYACSALSHWYHDSPLRTRFRQLDQAFIFLVIVATYTPFSLAHLDAAWWWILLASMWTIAVYGFLSKLFFGQKVENVTIWIYMLLGWMPALGGAFFASEMPFSAAASIMGGGFFFSIGAVFLILDAKCWFFHPIWHVMVIAGSAVHYWGVMHCL